MSGCSRPVANLRDTGRQQLEEKYGGWGVTIGFQSWHEGLDCV